MSDIRIKSQDFTIVGAHSPQGQTFSARVYVPLAEALADPRLFAEVAGGIQVLDTIRLSRTDKGSLKSDKGNKAYETVELMVVGFEGRLPRVKPLGRIQDLTRNVGLPEDMPEDALAAFAAASVGDELAIEEQKTGQGRGKPPLLTYLVKDTAGNVLMTSKDRAGAEQFIKDFAPAE